MFRTLIFPLIVVFFATTVAAQDSEKEAKYNRVSEVLTMFNNQRVLSEIEPTQEQASEIKSIIRERNEARSLAQEKAQADGFSGLAWRDKLIELDTKCLAKIFKDVLLPHQRTRLDQLYIQSRLREMKGSIAAFLVDHLDERLGLDKVQKKNLKELSEAKRRELFEAVEKFDIAVSEIPLTYKLFLRNQAACILQY